MPIVFTKLAESWTAPASAPVPDAQCYDVIVDKLCLLPVTCRERAKYYSQICYFSCGLLRRPDGGPSFLHAVCVCESGLEDSDDDKCMNSVAVSLVHAWLLDNPGYYCTWVNSFRQLRYSPVEKRMVATTVGGHYRRLACWAKVVPALQCVCKFEVLVRPSLLGPPVRATLQRHDSTGHLIPRPYRVLVWS